MFLIRRLISALLLLVAWPLFAGGAFEISGKLELNPSLFWAIVLSSGAQLTIVAAGFVATPLKKGNVGFCRSVAFVFLLIQSVSGPIAAVTVLYYDKVGHADWGDSKWLTWSLTVSLSAITFLWLSSRAWGLSLRGKGKSEA